MKTFHFFKHLNSFLLTISLFALLASYAQAQQRSLVDIQNRINGNIVDIIVSGEKAKGIICGSAYDGIYVLTVRHAFNTASQVGSNDIQKMYDALSNPAINSKTIKVKLNNVGWISSKENKCHFWTSKIQHKYYDFAILKIKTSYSGWRTDCLASTVSPNDRIRFLNDNRVPETGDISKLNTNNRYNIKVHLISTGSATSNGASGGPVWTPNGVIGILLNTDRGQKEVLPISSIKDILIDQDFGGCFQLKNTPYRGNNVRGKYLTQSSRETLLGKFNFSSRGGINREWKVVDPNTGVVCIVKAKESLECTNVEINKECSTLKVTYNCYKEGSRYSCQGPESSPINEKKEGILVAKLKYENGFIRVIDPQASVKHPLNQTECHKDVLYMYQKGKYSLIEVELEFEN